MPVKILPPEVRDDVSVEPVPASAPSTFVVEPFKPIDAFQSVVGIPKSPS